eukprot:2257549-Rhodomonas_salina.1
MGRRGGAVGLQLTERERASERARLQWRLKGVRGGVGVQVMGTTPNEAYGRAVADNVRESANQGDQLAK